MNDDEIINLFLKRDENGIIELSTKYHPYCYKIAWNLLANREDAEECLNDTWFSVWSQIPPTHPPVLAHFCGRITRNLSIDRLRKKFAGKRPDVHMARCASSLPDSQSASWFRFRSCQREFLSCQSGFPNYRSGFLTCRSGFPNYRNGFPNSQSVSQWAPAILQSPVYLLSSTFLSPPVYLR